MIIAIIPARGGSKGVPRKNLRPLCGKPLLAWSIEAAQAAKSVDAVFVSTEDAEIMDVAFQYGATSIVRPAELATDLALTDPVLVHAARAIPGVDLLVLLQPTVPVRPWGLIDRCIERAIETRADSVLTAYPLHFVWWRENGYQYDQRTGSWTAAAWRCQCPRRPRRQDMTARELMWHEDGSVYATRIPFLLETGRRLGGHMEVVENIRTVDIDTEEDFAVAEAMMQRKLRSKAAA